MAETVTITEVKEHRGLSKITFDFTTASDGTATGETKGNYSGLIYYVISDPDAGDDKPSANWDFDIQDEDNYDALNNAGDNRSSTATEYLQASKDGLGCVFQTKLTLEVSGGGDSNKGVVTAYIVN